MLSVYLLTPKIRATLTPFCPPLLLMRKPYLSPSHCPLQPQVRLLFLAVTRSGCRTHWAIILPSGQHPLLLTSVFLFFIFTIYLVISESSLEVYTCPKCCHSTTRSSDFYEGPSGRSQQERWVGRGSCSKATKLLGTDQILLCCYS